MFDVNMEGNIYFGTFIDNINILKTGMDKPLIRNEQFISVSVSGYKGLLPISIHEELKYLSSIYCEKYNASTIEIDGKLKWKNGYRNSITFIDGFGPNNNDTYNCFGEEKTNDSLGKKITIVLHKNSTNLVIPVQDMHDTPFEYYSTALHPFVSVIKPNDIIGIIVDSKNEHIVTEFLSSNSININVWKVENI